MNKMNRDHVVKAVTHLVSETVEDGIDDVADGGRRSRRRKASGGGLGLGAGVSRAEEKGGGRDERSRGRGAEVVRGEGG